MLLLLLSRLAFHLLLCNPSIWGGVRLRHLRCEHNHVLDVVVSKFARAISLDAAEAVAFDSVLDEIVKVFEVYAILADGWVEGGGAGVDY